MRDSLRGIALLGAIALSTAAPLAAAAATTVQISIGKGQVLKGARLTKNGSFLGFVGDLVELDDGQHEIGVHGPKSYLLVFTVRIRDRRVDIVSTGHRPENCRPQLSVDWPAPLVFRHKRLKDVTVVELKDPRFGPPTGITQCTSASMIGCTKQKVLLAAVSEPPDAEIWINGEKLPYRTNVELSVPYCAYEESKEVLLRVPDRVNCARKITLAPDRRVTVNCTLVGPGEAGADETAHPPSGGSKR
jgi:hypothetical protein